LGWKTTPPPRAITAPRKLAKVTANPIPTTTSRPSGPQCRQFGVRFHPARRYNQPEPTLRPSRSVPARVQSAPQAPGPIRFSQSEVAARSATLLVPKGRHSRVAMGVSPWKSSRASARPCCSRPVWRLRLRTLPPSPSKSSGEIPPVATINQNPRSGPRLSSPFLLVPSLRPLSGRACRARSAEPRVKPRPWDARSPG
jgi:hypothetical protein